MLHYARALPNEGIQASVMMTSFVLLLCAAGSIEKEISSNGAVSTYLVLLVISMYSIVTTECIRHDKSEQSAL